VPAVVGLLGDQALGRQHQCQVAEPEQRAPQGELGQGAGQAEQYIGDDQDQNPAGKHADRPVAVGDAAQGHRHQQRDHREGGGDETDHPLVGPEGEGAVGGDRPGKKQRRLGQDQRDQDPPQPPGHRRIGRGMGTPQPQSGPSATTMPSSSL
jgi:hypothetical protein